MLTAFEKELKFLGLAGAPLETVAASAIMRGWCFAHRFTRYVPEELLDRWNMRVIDDDERLLTN